MPKHGTLNMILFGARLRELVTKAGISITRLARQSDMNESQLVGVVRGRCGLSDEKIRNISKILGEDPLVLLRLAWLDRMPEDVRKMFLKK